MNDPGLEDPIHTAASQAQNVLDDGSNADIQQAEVQQDQSKSSTIPTRYWYMSTAFPLIAGTFGPLANAFSICALVENWRVSIPPGGTEEHGIDVRDPRWLIAVNAVSLAFALIANASLLLNMAKRLRFEIAQPVTICGFWIASVLLIGLLSFASTERFHAPGVQDQALTQAFYYAIFAAGQYQIISYLMCLTAWGAWKGHYPKDFELTMAQRTLMLQTISFLVYLLIGALIFSHIEGWKFLDAVYWMDFTLLTVGIGDYAPATHLGRSLLFPFAIGGIITVGLVVSSIRALILDRGAEQISARVMEKTRRQVLQQIDASSAGQRTARSFTHIRKETAKTITDKPNDDHTTELKRRKLEFETMRTVQGISERKRRYMALLFSTTAFALLWLVGAVVFWKAEKNQNWSYFQSLYFCYTSILTIGYGDLYPMSNSGKPFFVFWSLLAVPTLTILISNMGDTVVKGVKDLTIWLGELTFLPSTDASTIERVKIGIYRATLGKIKFAQESHDNEQQQESKEEVDSGWANFRETHPGLVQLFDVKDKQHIDTKDVQALNHLTKVWEALETVNEAEARRNHDESALATHHYRHLLISHIPRIYADTKLPQAKRYSYAEWAFYLRLLGEDESNGALHVRAQLPSSKHRKTEHRQSSPAHATSSEADESRKKSTAGSDHVSPKWSWIGRMSPLMQEKDEAEWILEKLFNKLEQSLREATEQQQHLEQGSCSDVLPGTGST